MSSCMTSTLPHTCRAHHTRSTCALTLTVKVRAHHAAVTQGCRSHIHALGGAAGGLGWCKPCIYIISGSITLCGACIQPPRIYRSLWPAPWLHLDGHGSVTRERDDLVRMPVVVQHRWGETQPYVTRRLVAPLAYIRSVCSCEHTTSMSHGRTPACVHTLRLHRVEVWLYVQR